MKLYYSYCHSLDHRFVFRRETTSETAGHRTIGLAVEATETTGSKPAATRKRLGLPAGRIPLTLVILLGALQAWQGLMATPTAKPAKQTMARGMRVNTDLGCGLLDLGHQPASLRLAIPCIRDMNLSDFVPRRVLHSVPATTVHWEVVTLSFAPGRGS